MLILIFLFLSFRLEALSVSPLDGGVMLSVTSLGLYGEIGPLSFGDVGSYGLLKKIENPYSIYPLEFRTGKLKSSSSFYGVSYQEDSWKLAAFHGNAEGLSLSYASTGLLFAFCPSSDSLLTKSLYAEGPVLYAFSHLSLSPFSSDLLFSFSPYLGRNGYASLRLDFSSLSVTGSYGDVQKLSEKDEENLCGLEVVFRKGASSFDYAFHYHKEPVYSYDYLGYQLSFQGKVKTARMTLKSRMAFSFSEQGKTVRKDVLEVSMGDLAVGYSTVDGFYSSLSAEAFKARISSSGLTVSYCYQVSAEPFSMTLTIGKEYDAEAVFDL